MKAKLALYVPRLFTAVVVRWNLDKVIIGGLSLNGRPAAEIIHQTQGNQITISDIRYWPPEWRIKKAIDKAEEYYRKDRAHEEEAAAARGQHAE